MRPLEPADFRTTVWAKVQAHLQGRLDELRLENDALLLSWDQTLIKRARIDEIKELLALPQEGPADAAGRDNAQSIAQEGI